MVQKSGCHQLRLVAYLIIYKVLYIPGGCLGLLPSTVSSQGAVGFVAWQSPSVLCEATWTGNKDTLASAGGSEVMEIVRSMHTWMASSRCLQANTNSLIRWSKKKTTKMGYLQIDWHGCLLILP